MQHSRRAWGSRSGTGTDVAIESSDLTLIAGDLRGVVTSIRLTRQTFPVILQNLGWAFGYNTTVIPLAAVGLLHPILAGAAMAPSSVSVVSKLAAAAPLRAAPRDRAGS